MFFFQEGFTALKTRLSIQAVRRDGVLLLNFYSLNVRFGSMTDIRARAFCSGGNYSSQKR